MTESNHVPSRHDGPKAAQGQKSASSQQPGAATSPAARGTSATSDRAQPRGSWNKGRWVLLLIIAICAAPVLVSYFTYYVIKPRGGSTNYGALVEPQRPIPPALHVTDENGHDMLLSALDGHWLLISVNASDCGDACAQKLYFMRQVRLTQGAERDRVQTVWLRTDSAPIPQKVRAAYEDTRTLVADPAALAAWLPAQADTQITDHIYLVDPNGNLMMRFPKDADPSKIKRDLSKLLKINTGLGTAN